MKMKKAIHFIIIFFFSAGFICLTIWCNTPYPFFYSYPVNDPAYSSAKIHLMTTDALVGTMLNQSFGVDTAYLISKPYTLYHLLTGFENTFDWTKEMLQREDIGLVIYQFYCNAKRPLTLAEKYPMDNQDFQMQNHVMLLHALLAHPKVQNTMTDQQRNNVLNRVLKTRNWTSNYPFFPYYPYVKDDSVLLGEGDYESYSIDYPMEENGTFHAVYYTWDKTRTVITQSQEFPLSPFQREKGWKHLFDLFYKQSSKYQINSFENRLIETGYFSPKDEQIREKTSTFFDPSDTPYFAPQKRYNRIGDYDQVNLRFLWDSAWEKGKRKSR